MKSFLAVMLFWLSVIPASAVDMMQPASVHITVRDSAGHTLPRASLSLGTDTIRLDADGSGHFETRAPQPATDIFWVKHLRVTLKGYMPFENDINFFPSANIALPITLYPPRTTHLHLHGPNGVAMVGVSVEVNYEAVGSDYLHTVDGYTDSRGDYVFTHPPLNSGFILSVGRSSRSFDSPEYPDLPEVTVTLRQSQVPPSFPPHAMQLTLIAPDGTPAAGWQVAPHVSFTGSAGFDSMISLSRFTNYYAVSGLIHANKSGIVPIAQAEDRLAVISPQGIPFLYPLHPQTWPNGVLHHVTLRLPPVRRTLTGRLTYPDGKPAANFPIQVSRARTGMETWRINSKEPIGTIYTDADGRYALPQYFGTSYEYEASRLPWAASELTSDHAVLEPYPGMEPRLPFDYKQITLTFVDFQGKLLPEMGVDFQGPISPVTDTRGVHLFVPNASESAVIKTQAHDWNLLTKTLALTSTSDQEFTVTVPQSLHMQPLGGVLVDSAGRPIPGVTIPLYSGSSYPNSPDKHFLQFSATTDAHGNFAFAAAPDSCEIDLYRFDVNSQADLPGWTDPPLVTPQIRDMAIRLKPFLTSSVRVLLPVSVVAEPKEIYLETVIKRNRDSDYLIPIFDSRTHTLLWNRIPPGQYRLVTENPTILPATARLDQTVTLIEGRETTLDLRDRAATFPQSPKPVTRPISVGVSGAVVTLWTDQQPYERHLPADLSDDDGMVWLPLGQGQKGIVVAHIAGKMIGYAALMGADEGGISFGMQEARTLTVPLKPLPLVDGKPPYDSRTVSLRPANMQPDEAQALFMVLGLLSADTGFLGDGPTPLVPMRQDFAGNWIAQDLPPGSYRLQTESDVTLP